MAYTDSGIYSIEHIESGRKYIGSAVSIRKRWWEHQCRLRKGGHNNAHLQNAWNKYGEAAFVFRVLIFCSKENLLAYEQCCMDGYKACGRDSGFNIAVTAGSALGTKRSEATCLIQRTRPRQPHTAETKAKMRAAKLGVKATLAAREARARKLTMAKAEAIRALEAAGGKTRTEIAELFNISPVTVCMVIKGKRWAWSP